MKIKAIEYLEKAYIEYKKARKNYAAIDKEMNRQLKKVTEELNSGNLNRHGKIKAQNSISGFNKERETLINDLREEFSSVMNELINDVTDVFKPLHGTQADELNANTVKLIESGMLSETETRDLLKDATPTTFRYCVNLLDDNYRDLHIKADNIADKIEVHTLESAKGMFLRGLRADKDLADNIDKYIHNQYIYEAKEVLKPIEIERNYPLKK